MLCFLSLGADGFIPLERFADDADFLSLAPQMDPLASPSPSAVVGGDFDFVLLFFDFFSFFPLILSSFSPARWNII